MKKSISLAIRYSGYRDIFNKDGNFSIDVDEKNKVFLFMPNNNCNAKKEDLICFLKEALRIFEGESK